MTMKNQMRSEILQKEVVQDSQQSPALRNPYSRRSWCFCISFISDQNRVKITDAHPATIRNARNPATARIIVFFVFSDIMVSSLFYTYLHILNVGIHKRRTGCRNLYLFTFGRIGILFDSFSRYGICNNLLFLKIEQNYS